MWTVSTVAGSAVGAPTLHLWFVLGFCHMQNDAMVELSDRFPVHFKSVSQLSGKAEQLWYQYIP